MGKLFFTDKSALEQQDLLTGFTDSFPVAVVDRSGAFLLHGGSSVGLLLSCGGAASAEHMTRISVAAARWLSSTSLVDSVTTITTTVYRKVYPDAEEKDGSTDGGGVMLRLRSEILLGLTVDVDDASGGAKAGPMALMRNFVSGGYEERVLRAVDVAANAADELALALRGVRVIARRIESPAAMVEASRFFWTAERTRIKGMEDKEIAGKPPGAAYAKGFSVGTARTFWVEHSDLRVFYGLRVPGRPSVASDPTDPDDLQRRLKVVASASTLSDAGLIGTHVLSMSLGGRYRVDQSARVMGYLGDDAAERLAKEAAQAAAEALENRRSRAKKQQLLAQKPWEKGPLRLAVNFVSSSPLTESLWSDIGTWKEQMAILSHERALGRLLAKASAGGDWQLLDTTWVEALYAVVPGACRLNGQGISSTLDVIFCP